MNMHVIDWLIVAAMLAVLTFAALRTMRYTRSVSAFLAAERLGGRYLISVANAMAGLGVISLVGYFEQGYDVAYTSIWWPLMEGPVFILMAISGWVIYRFRQTRAMTLAQFFEMRYSRNFRVFAGLVAFLSGIVNFGIFPFIGAHFFISYFGLPIQIELLGITCDTFPAMMIALLAIALLYTFLGGMIAVMVTDFLQGTFSNIVFAVIIIYLLRTFSWDQIGETLLSAPAGKSMVNPFDLGKETNFDFAYYLIDVLVLFYGILAWQGAQGYSVCAKNAHEAKMAGILNHWRYKVLMLIVLVAPICVKTFLEHPDFAEQAAPVHEAMVHIADSADTPEQAQQLESKLRIGATLAIILPPGLTGLFGAAMLAAFISTHDTYLHSWGSIFVQDVLLPFRKKPFSAKQQMWILRLAILGVAAFIFVFSMFYNPTERVNMFARLTGAIFVGGAGAVIIGGLYWRRGTAAGAWTALITAATFSMAGIWVHQQSPDFYQQWVGGIVDAEKATFWDAPLLYTENQLATRLEYIKLNVTGQVLNFWAIAMAVTMYIGVSLMTCRKPFNLDKMLHRGRYAIEGDESLAAEDRTTWLEKLGFTREFTGKDKVVAYVSLSWPLVWTVIFLIGTGYCVMRNNAEPGWVTSESADEGWLMFWQGYTWVILLAAVCITTWFAIGGVMDLRYLFHKLRTTPTDVTDDGRVDNSDNADTDTPTQSPSQTTSND